MQGERDDDPAASGELVPPGGGQVPCAGGHDDPVVRGACGIAVGAVGADDFDVLVACPGEAAPGRVGDVGVDVDGGHVAAGSCQLGEQGGVEPGAGADLQHLVAGAHGQLLQHRRDEVGAGG